MSLFKCLCFGIVAILLCGCGESRAEFSPLNLGKVNVVYENQTLKIAESRANSAESQNLNKKDSCEAPENSPASWCKKSGEASSSASADFLLEAEKRGSPSKSEKRQLLARRGSGEGGAALLRERKNNNENAESIKNQSIDCHADSQNLLAMTENKKIAESSLDSAPKDNAPFILFFFTSTCGVCKAQIPILEQLSAQGIRIYAILGDIPDISKASAFASAHKISLPLFYESSAKRFFSQIVGGVKGVPVVVIFDKNGKIKERFIGLTPKGVLKGAL